MKNDFKLSHNTDKYTQPISFHSHDYFEIYFFVDGKVNYYVESERYEMKKGDVLIIPPGKLHRPVIRDNAAYERYVLWIYPAFLANDTGIFAFIQELNNLVMEKKTHLISFSETECSSLCALLNLALDACRADDELSGYTATSSILLLLDQLYRKLQAVPPASCAQGDLIPKVIVYLNDNFIRTPSLEELSDAFFVSKYYLAHRFKEYTKTTIHNYILMKKINLAKELLNKGTPSQMVCEQCGFSTYSNFYKAFVERVGTSPRKYARQISSQVH